MCVSYGQAGVWSSGAQRLRFMVKTRCTYERACSAVTVDQSLAAPPQNYDENEGRQSRKNASLAPFSIDTQHRETCVGRATASGTIIDMDYLNGECSFIGTGCWFSLVPFCSKKPHCSLIAASLFSFSSFLPTPFRVLFVSSGGGICRGDQGRRGMRWWRWWWR